MKKLLNDLLKSPTGKYSRKSVYALIFLIFLISIGTFIVIDDTRNEDAKEVFDSSLIFLGILLGLTAADKKFLNKVPDPKEE